MTPFNAYFDMFFCLLCEPISYYTCLCKAAKNNDTSFERKIFFFFFSSLNKLDTQVQKKSLNMFQHICNYVECCAALG